jgi:diguanylate cyclase (GGDEF)-like protein/PAS domain S-box-containing protein
MRSYLALDSSPRFLIVLSTGITMAILLVVGGVYSVRKVDGYVSTMFDGNVSTLGHLSNIRSAIFDIRRLHWRTFALREPTQAAEYSREIDAQLAVISKEWALYDPNGISSEQEALFANQIRIELPKAKAMVRESLLRLRGDDYASIVQWYQERIPFLDHLDQLIARDIAANIEQGAQFSALSKQVFTRFVWVAVALFCLGIVAIVGLSLHWRRQRDNAERTSREHLWLVDQVFNITMDSVIITNRLGQITKVNPAFETMTGYTKQEVLGRNPDVLNSGRQSPEFYHEMWQCLIDHGHWEGRLWNRKKNGDLYLESLSITAVPGLKKCDLNYVAVCSDITQQHAEQEFQGYLATHDVLTGLPNRLLFHERLIQALARAHRSGARVAIMFLDLDHFKDINDNLGHAVGDGTLVKVAKRLKSVLRDVDTVARLGGDEFAFIREDIHDVTQIEPVARKLLASVGEPILSEGHQVSVTPSIGVSIYPDHGSMPEELVDQADQAMYEAKKSGKNAVRFFSPASGIANITAAHFDH